MTPPSFFLLAPPLLGPSPFDEDAGEGLRVKTLKAELRAMRAESSRLRALLLDANDRRVAAQEELAKAQEAASERLLDLRRAEEEAAEQLACIENLHADAQAAREEYEMQMR